MEKFNKIVCKIAQIADYVGGVAMVLMVVIITANVILRKMGLPLNGAAEYVQFLLATCVGLSIGNCAAKGAHVEISVLVDRLPKVPKLVIELLMGLVTLIFVAAIAYYLYGYGMGYVVSGQVGMISRMPYYPFIWAVGVGFVIYTLVVINQILQLFGKEDEPK